MTGSREQPSSGSPITHLHHIRIAVSDPWASRDWYSSILECEALLDLEDEDGVVGVLLRHSASGVILALHRDPAIAAALRGFPIFGLAVPDLLSLRRYATWLDDHGADHSCLREGHLGSYIDVPDPDGIVIRVHSDTPVASEDA